MKKGIIRIIMVALSLVMILSSVPTALALPTTYDLWVGGQQITDSNATDVFGDGKVSFNPDTNTLTLKNYTYEGAGYAFTFLGQDSAASIYSGLDTLNITVIGSNSIAHSGQDRASYGIFTEGNLVINEDSTGTLQATGGVTNTRSIGIFVSNKDLTINGATVTGVGSNASANDLSTGVWCLSGNITVGAKAELIGTGAVANISRGVCAFGKLAVNGGVVKGNGGAATQISQGISAGTVESSSDKSVIIGVADNSNESIGIVIWNDSVFEKGTIKGFSGATPSNKNYGIGLHDSFTISGGTVEAMGAGGAFDKKPTIDSVFSNAKVWYGETEAAADNAGAKKVEDIETKYTQKYVRIAPVSTEVPTSPNTGDSGNVLLWVILAMLSGGCLLGTLIYKKKA